MSVVEIITVQNVVEISAAPVVEITTNESVVEINNAGDAVDVSTNQSLTEVSQPANVVDVVSSVSVVEINNNKGIQGIQGEPGTGGGVAESETFEKTSKNLASKPYSLNRTSGKLTSLVYILGGGQTITKTLNYTGSRLESIVLSGDTPNGIDLTKTLSYTSGKLTGVTYG